MRAAERTIRSPVAFVALALAASASVLVYALVRTFERLALLEPNPAALVWSERSAIFWRMVIALYAGGAAAFGGVALARRAPEKATRLVLVTLVAALFVATVQGAVWP
jgi:hypothetical protein